MPQVRPVKFLGPDDQTRLKPVKFLGSDDQPQPRPDPQRASFPGSLIPERLGTLGELVTPPAEFIMGIPGLLAAPFVGYHQAITQAPELARIVTEPGTLGILGEAGKETGKQLAHPFVQMATDPSLATRAGEAGTLLAAPVAARAGTAALAKVGRRVRAGATLLHERAAETTAQAVAKRFPTKAEVDQLYNLAEKFEFPVPVQGVRAVADDVIKTEAASAVKIPEIVGVAQRLKRLSEPATSSAVPEMSFQNLRRQHQRIRDKAGEATGEARNAWNKLAHSLDDAMESAGTARLPGAGEAASSQEARAAALAANTANRRYSFGQDVGNLVKGAVTTVPESGAVRLNVPQILKGFDSNKNIQRFMKRHPEEVAEIRHFLEKVNRDLPPISTVSGPSTAGVVGRGIGSATVGGLVGYATGDVGTGAGVASVLSTVTLAVPPLLSTAPGRALLHRVLIEGKGVISPQAAAMLAYAARMQSGPQDIEPSSPLMP